MDELDYTGIQCAYCTRRFQLYDNLREHRRIFHNIPYWVTEQSKETILNIIERGITTQ